MGHRMLRAAARSFAARSFARFGAQLGHHLRLHFVAAACAWPHVLQ
jgi:hypothetical protein